MLQGWGDSGAFGRIICKRVAEGCGMCGEKGWKSCREDDGGGDYRLGADWGGYGMAQAFWGADGAGEGAYGAAGGGAPFCG